VELFCGCAHIGSPASTNPTNASPASILWAILWLTIADNRETIVFIIVKPPLESATHSTTVLPGRRRPVGQDLQAKIGPHEAFAV
jgi:hypothetical protein